MHRSTKGFGLTSVAVIVVLMLVTAVFSSSAQSQQFEGKTQFSQTE